MARVTKEIKASGGDYSGLAAFEDALSGSTAADPWTALCFSGFDMGEVTFQSIGYTPTSQAEAPWVIAAGGHGHKGNKTLGAYISATAAKGIYARVPYMLFDGIRVAGDGSQNGIRVENVTGTKIINCLIEGCNIGLYVFMTATGTYLIDIYNNLLLDNTTDGLRYKLQADSTSPTVTSAQYHNVVNGTTGDGISYKVQQVSTGTPTLNVTSRNNIVVGSGSNDYEETNTSGVISITSSNNLSEDATADDWSGAGHLINQTLAGIFTDEPNDVYTLKNDSPAIYAGYDLTGVVDADILGRRRSTPYSVGAFDYYRNLRNRRIFSIRNPRLIGSQP